MFGDSPLIPGHAPSISVDASLPAEAEELKAAELTAPAPTPEQIRAAEAVFAQQDEENRQVAGLLGVWSGALLLHDLAVDHLKSPADEEQPQLRKKDEEDEEDEE